MSKLCDKMYKNKRENIWKEKGGKNGTKDELSIHIFYTSLCSKRNKISKIPIKNAKRRKLQAKKIWKRKRFKIVQIFYT